MSIASSASEDGWVPTVYDSVEKVKGTAENKRTVCCVIPYDSSSRSVLMISSQKKPGMWTLPKGGKEEGEPYAEAALREAWEEGGILGYITSECICQIDTERNHVFFYPLQVSEMKAEWPENGRGREWVSVEEAIARAYWRPEQAEALQAFSTWRDTLVESDTSNESSESGLQLSPPGGECFPCSFLVLEPMAFRTPRRLLAQLSRSVPAAGPSFPARSYRFLASVPPQATPPPAPTSAVPPPPAVAPEEPTSTSSDVAGPSSVGEPSSPATASSPSADGAAPSSGPVRLTVPEAEEGRTILGSSGRPLKPRIKQSERRRLKALALQPQAEPTTDIGRLIRAAPLADRRWRQVLERPLLTMAQKLEYLADPAAHAASFPATTRPDEWLPFVQMLGRHLNPSNPMLQPPDDVRSDQLRLGVARILQHQQADSPFLLLRLLRLAHATDVASSQDVWNTLVGIVKSTRQAWWTEGGNPPFPADLVNSIDDVDSMRQRLLSDGVADAWDQQQVVTEVLAHRRRLSTFLVCRRRMDRSVPAAQANDKPSVAYVSSFLTTSAVQHATDPVVLLFMLEGYLLTAPSERGQACFDATLALVPDLAQDWTSEHQRAIKKGIQDCSPGDVDMYVRARKLLRRELAPYLGSLADFWTGVFPSPRDMGVGVVPRAELDAIRKEARARGEDPYAPGGALDWNLERTPKLNRAQRTEQRERAIHDGRPDGASFGLRQWEDDPVV